MPVQVEFLHIGSGIQVKINAPEDRVREITEALQPMIPDLGSTNVHFNVAGENGGILVQKCQMFDSRPLVKAMLTHLNALDDTKTSEDGTEQPANRPESDSEGVEKPQHESESDGRTSSVGLTHKMAQEAVGYHDLKAMTSVIGIDYPLLLEQSLSKKPAAIFLMLWIAGNAPLDGASMEGYTYTMVRAAKEIGDDALSAEARKLDSGSQQAVAQAFLFEYGESDDRETAVSEVSKAFPKLWGAIRKHQGEQDGNGQSATRSDSKSENGDKHQTEAEGRSR